MAVSPAFDGSRFLERYQRLEKRYLGDAKGFQRGLMLFLKTSSHMDPEKEIAACVKAGDWKRLNDLFFQLTRLSLLPGAATGYDHSGRFLAVLDLAASEGPEAVKRYLPQELGLAKNGSAVLVHGMNLLLCLLYCKGKKAVFDTRKVLEDGERFTQTKRPLWERGVVQFLICLYEDRPAGMRTALKELCVGYERMTLPQYQRMQCLNAYGLVMLAQKIAPPEVFRELTFQEANGFSLGYLEWRLGQEALAPELYLPYPEPAGIINELLLAEPGPLRIAQLKAGNSRCSPQEQKVWYEDSEKMAEELLSRVISM